MGQPPIECRYIERPKLESVAEAAPTDEPLTVKVGHPFAKEFMEFRHQAGESYMFYTTEHCERCGWITAIRIAAGV